MVYRMMKFALTGAYIALVVLTWRFFTGKLDWGFALGAVALSSFWLVLTWIQLRSLFRTYFDTLSRLQVLVPFWVGLVLSGLAAYANADLPLRLVSLLVASWWLYIYVLYRRNRRHYIKQGHGPLPAGSWINPPPAAMLPGDLILTSGRMAGRLQESVGHGEVVIVNAGGKPAAFSSYMEKGAIINDLDYLCKAWARKGEHWIVLRLKGGFTPEQSARATAIAAEMIADNSNWRDKVNGRRRTAVNILPLPAGWRNWLFDRIRASGYDWPGLFIGTRACNRWTCIGACLELLHRLGVKTRQYGTGLLGLGTGLFNPIMPVRFLADNAFRLLTEGDRKDFEGRSEAATES